MYEVLMGDHMKSEDDDRSRAEEQLAEAIILAGHATSSVAAQAVSQAAHDLTLPQHRALVVLAELGPLHLADLALTLGVSPSTVTRMCDRLVRRGLITRTRDELDRRDVDLSLKDAGKALVDEVARRRKGELRNIFAKVPNDELDWLIRALHSIAEASGNKPEGGLNRPDSGGPNRPGSGGPNRPDPGGPGPVGVREPRRPVPSAPPSRESKVLPEEQSAFGRACDAMG